ncbi:hypothetical protein [uncultured Microbacterium sp.]|uniref:hypothetical protein n=1 Tax=uncultured Microbacterium sp. TaxID=191216 RepID=UPI0025CEC4CA|nr:hypothetical protein [uncultured Microbacterium sp.]
MSPTPASAPATRHDAHVAAVAAAPRRTTWRATILLSIAAAAAVTIIVLAFLWPVVTASAKNIPLGLVGLEQATAQVAQNLDEHASGVFVTSDYASRDDAVAAIEHRELYGAIVVGQSPEVLIASAASPAVATILRGLAQTLQQQVAAQVQAAGGNPASVTVAVTDVVPLSSNDQNGQAIAALGFPIVMGGMIGGILISLLVAGVTRRLTALLGYAVIGGAAVTLVLHTWFQVLPGHFAPIALGIGLGMLGTASAIVGLNALIGPRGIAIGAIITMLVGNPISAAALPALFLVGPWGEIGQYFVPGAAATLIRDLCYFPDTDMTRAWVVLAAWAVGGVVLSAVGHFRNREVVHVPAFEEPAAA